MTPEQKLRAFCLRAVDQCGGRPLPETALVDALRLSHPHIRITDADAVAHIRSCETAGWIVGIADDLLGVQWSLTPAGRARLATLP